MTVYGWDISNHDWVRHKVNLANARKAGISFVTHKATEGCPAAGQYVDPYFAAFAGQLQTLAGGRVRRAARRVAARLGLATASPFPVAGSYHVTHAGHAVQQADFWFQTVTAKYPAWRQHGCWLWQIDAEPLDGYAAPSKADILALGQRLEQHGLDPALIVVYAPRWVYGDSLQGLPWRLWASNYAARGRSFASLYPGDHGTGWAAYSGQTPLILQYTSGATIGAQPTCDANAVRVADEDALLELFGRDWLSMATKAEVQAVVQAAIKAATPDIAKAVAAELLATPMPNAYGGHPAVGVVLRAIDQHVNQALAAVTAKPGA